MAKMFWFYKTFRGGLWTYGYDAENRLVSAANGLITASYAYGPLDRRIAKAVTTSGGSPVETRYVYAGDDVIVEYTGAGTLLRQYVHGPWVDEPVVMLDPTQAQADEQVQYYHADHAGTIVATSDAAGVLAETYTYSAFGEVGPEGVEGNPYRFTGRRLDPETGLYFYRARYYAAGLGRFLQTDPIGYEDSLGLYQYALNDPLRFKDPSGLATFRISGAFDFIVIGGFGVDLGVYMNPGTEPGEEFDFGFYGEIRQGNGLDISAGIEFATVSGSSENLSGKAFNLNGGVALFSATATTLPESAKCPVLWFGICLDSGAVAIEAGLPVSGSISESRSGKYGYLDVIVLIESLFSEASGRRGRVTIEDVEPDDRDEPPPDFYGCDERPDC